MNGNEVFRLATGRSASPASGKAPLRLRKDGNTVLFKLDNGVGAWAVCFGIRDADGSPASGASFIAPQ